MRMLIFFSCFFSCFLVGKFTSKPPTREGLRPPLLGETDVLILLLFNFFLVPFRNDRTCQLFSGGVVGFGDHFVSKRSQIQTPLKRSENLCVFSLLQNSSLLLNLHHFLNIVAETSFVLIVSSFSFSAFFSPLYHATDSPFPQFPCFHLVFYLCGPPFTTSIIQILHIYCTCHFFWI